MPTFTFDKTANIITVAEPDLTVTISELITAIRDFEDNQFGMDISKIADASGKEDLGGGVSVGLTLKLLDWKLKFADRAGPTTVLADVVGGNLIAVDANGDFVNPIEPSTFVTVTKTASSSATIASGDASAIADAVWNELISQHQNTGSFGETLFHTSESATNPPTASIADTVWNELIGEHQNVGSVGESLFQTSESSANPPPASVDNEAVAEAVWSQTTSSMYDKSGSAGGAIMQTLGLVQSNFRMVNQSYDVNDRLTSATIRIFKNSADTDSDTNPLINYAMSSSYDGAGNLTSYKVVEV